MEGTIHLDARCFRESLAAHWPEYLIETALVGIFLAAALYLYGRAAVPVLARQASNAISAESPSAYQSHDGAHCNCADLFAVGTALRSASQSVCHADLLSAAEDSARRRGILRFFFNS